MARAFPSSSRRQGPPDVVDGGPRGAPSPAPPRLTNVDSPEIIVTGLCHESAAGLLNALGRRATSGERLPVGPDTGLAVHGVPVRLLPVSRRASHEFLRVAHEFFDSPTCTVQALQAVWQDEQQRWPWEEGFDLAQPLLFAPPADAHRL